jgi:hypothetical protein
MSETRESELRELIAEAKGLPWSAGRDGTIGPLGYGVATIVAACPEDARADMAALIVAAVNDLPGLLDELSALRARVERVEAERDEAVAAEREACARLADRERAAWNGRTEIEEGARNAAKIIAQDIRARAAILSRIEKENTDD